MNRKDFAIQRNYKEGQARSEKRLQASSQAHEKEARFSAASRMFLEVRSRGLIKGSSNFRRIKGIK
ncbi:hypothetical protein C6H88_01355 [Chlamydia muridarum str. Nigg]|uniref:Uncharacterized protein n=1 Tax=Chlamydia muridarum TaxID=83560 RepID=A0A070A378_CHLMR|nr:hypothetical protein TAC_01360 [Chlamydia muridarum str. Nigg3 CMUT3-5]AHH23573.1 hypothetical protein Y015_01360 [Chlamydia muridarum str. Nigg CM972]AID37795.1 hypothetical protein BB17_01395 [Chlamydia muridarum str. Nigg 2 MCR]AIT90467.1 hypothetical protein NC80_01295 [Chlamydia muridarum]AVM88036.1 hypothetical protein C6H96_01355 [Chlamydia muridarum str. Nigg]UFT32676.1 hypothetical protein FTN61_01450 [Chlamydia trachomatis]